jgi:DmsE family decaheme c-type cytochrome
VKKGASVKTLFCLIVISSVLLLAVIILGDLELSAQEASRMSDACMDCHESALEGLMGSAHQIEAGDGDVPVACTDCHPGDERHMDDPEAYPRNNPSDDGVLMASQICAGCHMNSHQQTMQERNVHAANEVNCSGCHQVHGNARMNLLQDDEVDMCLGCHSDVKGHFAKPYRHPVSDGIMRCSECHMAHDVDPRDLSFTGTNVSCVSCHNQFGGPFPYEHQATVDYSVEEGGCLTCHEAHGAHLPRMLKQPFEAPNFMLCSQCHIVPKHEFNSQHGAMWSGVACNDCHVDIHGSYVSENFLSPTLQSQGCFNVGCHQF